jgi:hypothetical protein
MSVHQIGGKVFHYISGGGASTPSFGGLEYKSNAIVPARMKSEDMTILRLGAPHVGPLPTRYLYRTSAGRYASGDWNSFGGSFFQQIGVVPDPWFFMGKFCHVNVLGSSDAEGAALFQYDDRGSGEQVAGVEFRSIGPSTHSVHISTTAQILLPAGSTVRDSTVDWRPYGTVPWTRVQPGSLLNRCDATLVRPAVNPDPDGRFALFESTFLNAEAGAMRDVRILIHFTSGSPVIV